MGLVDLFNATRQGVNARRAPPLLRKLPRRAYDRRDYSPLFPALLQAKADQFNLEFANREWAQVELLRHFGSDQKVGVGVIDVKSYATETPEEVAAGLRRALEHVPAENVIVTPDCGFNHTPRHVAFRKIVSMARGAAIVREDLSKSS